MEALAKQLFDRLYGAPGASAPGQVFAMRDCVVVPSRIMEGWLRQFYLFDYLPGNESPRIIADCDFPLLNVFINDWLYRMEHAGSEERDPALHPFAPESLLWRLYNCLQEFEENSDPEFAAVLSFINAVGSDQALRDQRRFQLASRLAAVFDGYTVYRPAMLIEWERGKTAGLPEALDWQPRLWRRLVADGMDEKTYLAAFRRMDADSALAQCGIQNTYRAVHVFCPSIMPRVYQLFLLKLAEVLPVHFYLFNPSHTDWIALDQANRKTQLRQQLHLDAADEDPDLFYRENPLLAGLGRGVHEFLAELLDMSGGQLGDSEPAGSISFGNSVLARLQESIVENGAEMGAGDTDDSIQIHVCHSPRRELEVLRDNMLRWFSERDFQPRDIQVLVPDMAAYAPYIEAVFATPEKFAADTIPFVIADRSASGESLVAEGFMRLLKLADSRFSSLEVVQMLQCECIGQRFGIGQADVERVAEMISSAGIRWGRGVSHRSQVTEVEFTEATTWRHGLDRLLLGYMLGSHGVDVEDISPLPCDVAEGDDALLQGRLVRFVEELGAFADYCTAVHSLREWSEKLSNLIKAFFVSDNNSFRDVGMLHRAVETLGKSVSASETEDVSVGINVVRKFMQMHLQFASGGTDLTNNAVVFCALRPGSSTPRKALCMLGMVDGAFPRQDSRPAYDLLKVQRKRLDRTPRIDDRTAFLEALLSARDTLYLSYPGFSETDNQSAPSSVLIRELIDFAGEKNCKVVEHRLQAFSAVYFMGGAEGDHHFSYSAENCAAARARMAEPRILRGKHRAESPAFCGASVERRAESIGQRAGGGEVDIGELIGFFTNPAAYYCQHVLGVRYDWQSALVLPEQEEFDPDALVDYGVRDEVVRAQVTARRQNMPEVEERVFRRLTEQGQLPLGKWGREWFDEKWRAIGEMLAVSLGELGELQAALSKQESGESANLVVDIAPYSIYGTVNSFESGSGLTALHFRCVTPKAKGKIAVWLRHVLACSSGMPLTSYYCEISSLETRGKAECLALRPIEQATARALLEQYLTLYQAGQTRVLPFSQQASFEYVNKLYNPGKKTPADQVEHEAFKAAIKKWYSNFSRGDDADAYMQRAFGADGPFVDETDFSDNARTFWSPFFEHRAEVQLLTGDG